MPLQTDDQRFMRLALDLASQARGATKPNPMVGAVVVNAGQVVGQGYHRRAGQPHAEAEALGQAGEMARGATLYVTLEPCCHQDKRTPPCTEAIVRTGIRRVVYAMVDPNRKVCGKGSQALQSAGIEVDGPIMEQEAQTINEVYHKFMNTGLPFVTLKLAMSLDGRIAAGGGPASAEGLRPAGGESRGLTGREALERVHLMRLESEAVLVGANTVIADDPELTVRLIENPEGRQPTRFVVDSTLRAPLDRKVWDQSKAKTVLATTARADAGKLRELARREVEVWTVDADPLGRVDLAKLVRKMGLNEYYTLLVEGGGQIAAAMLNAGLVDKVAFFYAPRIIGAGGVPAIGPLGIDQLDKTNRIKNVKTKMLGQDIIIEGYLNN